MRYVLYSCACYTGIHEGRIDFRRFGSCNRGIFGSNRCGLNKSVMEMMRGGGENYHKAVFEPRGIIVFE